MNTLTQAATRSTDNADQTIALVTFGVIAAVTIGTGWWNDRKRSPLRRPKLCPYNYGCDGMICGDDAPCTEPAFCHLPLNRGETACSMHEGMVVGEHWCEWSDDRSKDAYCIHCGVPR